MKNWKLSHHFRIIHLFNHLEKLLTHFCQQSLKSLMISIHLIKYCWCQHLSCWKFLKKFWQWLIVLKSVKHESKRAIFSLNFSFWMMNGFYHIFQVFNLELFWKAWHVKEKGKVLQAFFNQKVLTEKSFF